MTYTPATDTLTVTCPGGDDKLRALIAAACRKMPRFQKPADPLAGFITRLGVQHVDAVSIVFTPEEGRALYRRLTNRDDATATVPVTFRYAPSVGEYLGITDPAVTLRSRWLHMQRTLFPGGDSLSPEGVKVVQAALAEALK